MLLTLFLKSEWLYFQYIFFKPHLPVHMGLPAYAWTLFNKWDTDCWLSGSSNLGPCPLQSDTLATETPCLFWEFENIVWGKKQSNHHMLYENTWCLSYSILLHLHRCHRFGPVWKKVAGLFWLQNYYFLWLSDDINLAV